MDPTESYIRTAAAQRGIDPDQAVRVARSEGLNSYTGDNGSSFGPFQLHYGNVAGGGNAVSGLGDTFTQQTGLNARDPSTVKQQIDFSLDHAAQNGWGPWHGWKGDPWAGINNKTQGQTMGDQPVMAQAMQQPQQQDPTPTLFGGNPTPVGGLSAIARMLGIGSDDGLGRRLQNAGAALQMPGNWGRSGAEGAAALMQAANAPHYQVVPTADGSRIVIDTRTGAPVSTNGVPVGQQGAGAAPGPGQTPNAQNAYNETLAKQSADEMAASATAYESAVNTKKLAAQAREVIQNPGVAQGASGELRNDIAKYLKQYTGVDLGGVDQSDTFGLLSKAFAANQAKQMGVTRYAGPEIAMASRSSISENNTREANLQHVSDLEHLADRTIAQHLARVKYATTHNGILGPGFQSALDEADKSTPTYELNPALKTAPTDRKPLSDIFK